MTVDFATCCCQKDMEKLYENFNTHRASHKWPFNHSYIVHQRVAPFEDMPVPENTTELFINKSDYKDILERNGIKFKNPEADKYTHGWSGPHYWQHHCVNHLVALENSQADYIVLSDADCYMKENPGWITEGIKILRSRPDVLVISPSDGGAKDARTTKIMSQQLFLCERERLRNIDFDLPFTGFKDGGPFAEYYFMLEGRIGRYMEKHNLRRYILGNNYRYWHDAW